MEPINTKEKINGIWQKTPEYRAWSHMKGRCNNVNDSTYHYYGGRGIKVYEPWSTNYKLFYKYIGKRPSNQHSLDRIDTNGDYEPGNIRWANRAVQARNKRIRVDNTSGYKNISKVRNGYNTRVHLGTYSTLQDAIDVQNKVYNILIKEGIIE
jgi:hypothetical protein